MSSQKTPNTVRPMQDPMIRSRNEIRKMTRLQPRELKPDQKVGFRLGGTNVKNLGNAFVIAVVGPMTEQFTVHKPLGITDLSDRDWVMSRSEDLPYAAARLQDPRAETIRKANAQLRNTFLADKHLLTVKEVEGGVEYYYPTLGDKTRPELIKEAKAIYDSKSEAERKATSWTDYLPAQQKLEESRINECIASEEYKEYEKANATVSDFRTTMGIDQRPQVAVEALHGLTGPSAMDTVIQMLNKTVAKGEHVTVNTVTTEVTKIDGSAEIQSLKEELKKLKAANVELEAKADRLQYELNNSAPHAFEKELEVYEANHIVDEDHIKHFKEMLGTMTTLEDAKRVSELFAGEVAQDVVQLDAILNPM